jgi:predicted ATP-dependent serine protease
MADEDTSLVGREEELSRLRGLVASPYTESRVLLLLGDPGMGKTVLLAEAARGARSAGMRVLAAAGRESGAEPGVRRAAPAASAGAGPRG